MNKLVVTTLEAHFRVYDMRCVRWLHFARGARPRRTAQTTRPSHEPPKPPQHTTFQQDAAPDGGLRLPDAQGPRREHRLAGAAHAAEPRPLRHVRGQRRGAPLQIVRAYIRIRIRISHVCQNIESVLDLTHPHITSPPPKPNSVYPANRVATAGGGKGSGKEKDKPRGVPGSLELLQSRIIAPQVRAHEAGVCAVGPSIRPCHLSSPKSPTNDMAAGGGLRLAPAEGGPLRAQRPRPDPARLPRHQA